MRHKTKTRETQRDSVGDGGGGLAGTRLTNLTINGLNGKWCHLSCFIFFGFFLHQSAISETDIRHKNVLTPAAVRGVWQETHAKTESQTLHKCVSAVSCGAILQSWYRVPLLEHNPHDPIISFSFYIVALLFAQLATWGLGDWQFHSWQILRCLTVWFLWDSVSECFGLRQGKDCDTSLSAGLSVKALQRAGNWAASDFRLLYIYMWLITTS